MEGEVALISDCQTATTQGWLSSSCATSTPLHAFQTIEITAERHGGVLRLLFSMFLLLS